MSDDREAMRDRFLEAALKEVHRAEPAPDVAPRVRAALDGDPAAAGNDEGDRTMVLEVIQARRGRRWPWWLAAAACLLTIGVLLVHGGDGDVEGPAAPEPERPPWGAPVDGLRLGLDVSKTTWKPGQRLTFSVRAENVGKTPLRLSFFEDRLWHHRIRFESLDGGPEWAGGAGLFLDYERDPLGTIAPGATWRREAMPSDGERRYLRIIPDRKPGDDWDYRDELPPGRYRATLTYARSRSGDDEGEGTGFWAGKVVSNPLTITIAKPARRR